MFLLEVKLFASRSFRPGHLPRSYRPLLCSGPGAPYFIRRGGVFEFDPWGIIVGRQQVAATSWFLTRYPCRLTSRAIGRAWCPRMGPAEVTCLPSRDCRRLVEATTLHSGISRLSTET